MWISLFEIEIVGCAQEKHWSISISLKNENPRKLHDNVMQAWSVEHVSRAINIDFRALVFFSQKFFANKFTRRRVVEQEAEISMKNVDCTNLVLFIIPENCYSFILENILADSESVPILKRLTVPDQLPGAEKINHLCLNWILEWFNFYHFRIENSHSKYTQVSLHWERVRQPSGFFIL